MHSSKSSPGNSVFFLCYYSLELISFNLPNTLGLASVLLSPRILVLEGIEKAERNVLPVLNNLLENREMHLEDGRLLIPADREVKEIGERETSLALFLAPTSWATLVELVTWRHANLLRFYHEAGVLQVQ